MTCDYRLCEAQKEKFIPKFGVSSKILPMSKKYHQCSNATHKVYNVLEEITHVQQ